jgi:hypothetical protein
LDRKAGHGIRTTRLRPWQIGAQLKIKAQGLHAVLFWSTESPMISFFCPSPLLNGVEHHSVGIFQESILKSAVHLVGSIRIAIEFGLCLISAQHGSVSMTCSVPSVLVIDEEELMLDLTIQNLNNAGFPAVGRKDADGALEVTTHKKIVLPGLSSVSMTCRQMTECMRSPVCCFTSTRRPMRPQQNG